jgi:tripartite-type tricarboxylate transporter receptor subunit TctC
VKVLAVTNHERAPALPDVPTAIEASYPSLEFDGLVGLFASPEMGADVRTRIADDAHAVAGDTAIVQKMIATGQTISPGNGAEFAASIAQQKAQVAAVAKLFGNKPVQ